MTWAYARVERPTRLACVVPGARWRNGWIFAGNREPGLQHLGSRSLMTWWHQRQRGPMPPRDRLGAVWGDMREDLSVFLIDGGEFLAVVGRSS